MTISGDHGIIRVGYQTAAVIGPWRLVRDEDTMGMVMNHTSSGSATAKSIDKYWITQRPVSISMWMGAAWWTWDRAEIELGDKGKIAIKVTGIPEVSRTYR